MSALNNDAPGGPAGPARGVHTTRWFWTRHAKILAAIGLAAIATSAGGFAMTLTAATPVPKAAGAATSPSPAAQVAVPAPGPSARGAYQMRCWQYGRLVMDEPLGQLPPEGDGHVVRLQGASGPYAMFPMGAATCLVKPVADRSPNPRP